MPIYDYKCENCGEMFEGFSNLDDYKVCTCSCGGKGNVCISVVKGGAVSDYERKRFPYYDEQLDKYLETKKQKDQVLKERGLVQHDGFFNKRKKRTQYFT